jgi:farnesyl-diphosphate farnesyltransferase
MNDQIAPELANVEVWSGKSRSDENFPVGSLLLSRAVRPHMHAYYGFARNADDIADSSELKPDEKVARLDVMEDVVLGRRPDGSPSASRLRESLTRTGVNAVHATDLLIAFRRDATKTRYETFHELMDYCRYSAAPVGRYVLDLHGESGETYEASDALCASLQILNHLQDCAADLRALDRCYIPQSLMRECGFSEADLLGKAETPALRRGFDALLDRVRDLNAGAVALPHRVRSRRLRAETMFICRLALRLTERLANGDPLAARVALTKMDAASSVLRALGVLVWR